MLPSGNLQAQALSTTTGHHPGATLLRSVFKLCKLGRVESTKLENFKNLLIRIFVGDKDTFYRFTPALKAFHTDLELCVPW